MSEQEIAQIEAEGRLNSATLKKLLARAREANRMEAAIDRMLNYQTPLSLAFGQLRAAVEGGGYINSISTEKPGSRDDDHLNNLRIK